MVSTRSGRVVSGVAGQGAGSEPTPGRGASSTRGARNGNGKAGASSKAPTAADATTGSLSLAGYDGTFDATMDQRQEDQDAVAAQQQLPKLTERKVLLSPRRGTPPASPSPAASPAQPSGHRMASPTSPASPSVAGWAAAGSAAAAAAQHLSAVPLPDESDEDQEQRQQQHGQTAAAHPQQKQAPPSHPSTRHAAAQGVPGFTVLLSALILCALCAAATLTLCTPGTLTPPLLTRLSIPPASQSLLLGLPSNPACQHVQPVSQLAQQHLSRLAPHVEQYAQLLRGTAQSYTTVLLQQVQQLVEHCRRLIAHLHQSCASLTQAGQGFTPSTPSGHAGQEPALAPGLHHAHARQVLQAAVPLVASSSGAVAEAWEAAAADAAAKQKALGVLLHCSSSDRCAAAVGKLLGNDGSDSGDSVAACAVDLHLDGGSGQEAAGQLQQRLTSLLAPLQAKSSGSRGSGSGSGGACKGLVVVARGLEAAPAAVVAVLSNALSESGNLQAGGAAVSMQRATFVFPITLQPANVHSLDSTSRSGNGGDALREANSPLDAPSGAPGPTPIPAEQEGSVEPDSPDSSDGESTSDAPRAPAVPSPAAAAARESEEVQLLLSSWASDAEALLAFSRWAKSALGSRQAAVWSSTDLVQAEVAEEAAGQQQEQQREALRRAFRRRIDLVLQA